METTKAQCTVKHVALSILAQGPWNFKTMERRSMPGPSSPPSTMEPEILPWWLKTKMYKTSRPAVLCFRQVSQKSFSKENKLNLTESLEENLIKLIVLTKEQGTAREREENRVCTYKYLWTRKKTEIEQEGVKRGITVLYGEQFGSVFKGGCNPLNYSLIPCLPWESF